MVSLPSEVASAMLAQLSTDDIERVSLEIAHLGEVPSELRNKIVDEFYQTSMARRYMEEGGMDYARDLLMKSLNPEEANKILTSLKESIQQMPFNFLKKAEAKNILTFLTDEHPQTIALILSHINSGQSSEILAGLQPKKQIDVVKRIAKMDTTTPEVIAEVEKGLEVRLSSIIGQSLESAGGVDSIAEILNLVDRTTEKAILENLEEEDPDLVEQIRRLMFVFEDVLLVNDKGIQSVLKEVEQEDLGLALKTASDDLKTKIFKNMSERAASGIQEDMEYMGPVRVSDVESAQQRIVDIVRRLEEAGEVIIQGRGGEDDVIV